MFKDIYNQASDMPISIIFMAIMLTCLGLIVLSSISTNQFDYETTTIFNTSTCRVSNDIIYSEIYDPQVYICCL